MVMHGGREMRGTNEDRFLGALLGMAIGDALGMPLVGMSQAAIRERYGEVDRFLARDGLAESGAKAGEFTDETEFALCIVESMTTNRGEIDPDNIGARLQYLAKGESRKWLSAATRAALERASVDDVYRVPLDEDGPATGDVAARGVPVGLLASVGSFNDGWLKEAAEAVTRLTHGSPAAIAATTAVAFGVQLAGRDVPPPTWASETAAFLETGELAEVLGRVSELDGMAAITETMSRLGTGAVARESVASAFVAAMRADRFEEAVFAAARAGGATDAVGAIAGALAGARFGASGIPQRLIDDLEGRIYVSLAAPWFYRAALHRSSLAIDMRLEGGSGEPPPRPTMPPRQ
ncbi:MAG TPA: ADP-ribosylglycohydrolase family protein [Thermomicrobiales bacterium]|nr:ADP-ribosylglycohydrolase family protein [Thermomicrobiales bacterium]